ncbi:MAG: class I SAM-dependent methyltransferase [Bacteroidota bacterium]|nr:class I SAM-dependent methyltransferase [Bacteroidota bacterium]
MSERKVLQKHPVSYFRCTSCSFIQTEEPFWLKEAYENVITSLDIGLVSRNLYLRETIPPVIDAFFDPSAAMIDYGGGYGLFVRMMRDLGYNFYRQDIYCDNLFAKHFDLSDSPDKKFHVLTAFEVFEHLPDPMKEIETMFTYADNVIFSTELAPENTGDFETWWYVAPETGQHISFYSLDSLEFIAKKFKKHLYSNGKNMHVFSSSSQSPDKVKKVLPGDVPESFLGKVKRRLAGSDGKKSLLQSDYEAILKMLNKS